MPTEEAMSLRRLYPEISDEELEAVEETLALYAALIARMVERQHAERDESSDGNGVK